MAKENVSFDLRHKKIDETAIYLLGGIKHNDLLSEKHKNTWRNLNYFKHNLLFISAVIGCVSVYAFPSLVIIPLGNARPAIVIEICAITAWVKKYKAIIKKMKKKHGKIELLAKTKLRSIKVLCSKALIDLNINHDEFVSITNVMRWKNILRWKKI